MKPQFNVCLIESRRNPLKVVNKIYLKVLKRQPHFVKRNIFIKLYLLRIRIEKTKQKSLWTDVRPYVNQGFSAKKGRFVT